MAARKAAAVAPAPPVPMLRTSERTTWRRCPQKWWWAYREGLHAADTPNALWFGIGIHLSLAAWYCGPGEKRGPHPAETFAEWVGAEKRSIRTNPMGKADAWTDDVFVDARQLGTGMLQHYIETYGDDGSWFILQPEQTFQVTIPREDGKTPLVIYCGTYDLAFRDQIDNDSIWLGEHKSYKAIQTGHLPLDDQVGGYWMTATTALRGLGLIGKREVLEGIHYNILRKALPDDRPRDAEGYALNKDGSRSKTQPTPFFHREKVYRFPAELRTQMGRIRAEATTMAAQRRGELPLWKNPTKDCQWDCQFRNMCELHEQGADWTEFRDAMFRVKDPYADHRKSAAE